MLPLSATLSYGSLGSVQLSLSDPWITRGLGGHRLTFPMESYASWLEDKPTTARTPMLLVGSAWTDLPGMLWLGSVVPLTFGLCGWRASGDDLAVELSDHQLFAIEYARAPHDDLRLHLKLEGLLLGADPDVYPIRKVDVPVSIRAARWVELLDQIGHGVGVTLHVPSPLTDGGTLVASVGEVSASYAQATLRLRQARDHLKDGAYEESVASCRRVLEIIGRLRSVPSASEVFKLSPRERTVDQRWAAIHHDLTRLTHMAHHEDETTVDVDWTREDAAAVLATTAGLVQRIRL